jgi:hypothetical protein
MTDWILITSTGDHGDEYELEGFAICDAESWEKAKKAIPSGAIETGWGTNEVICFDDADDMMSHLKERPISEAAAEGLCNLLGVKFWKDDLRFRTEYGIFVFETDYDQFQDHNQK